MDEADTADPRFARLLAIIHKACAQNPQDRYQTAKGLFKALQELKCEPARQPPSAVSRLRIAAVAAAVVVAAGAVGIRAFGPRSSVDPPVIHRTAADYLVVGEWRWRWRGDQSPATITFQFRTDGAFKASFEPDRPYKWPGLGFIKKGEGTWSCSEDMLTVTMTHVELPGIKLRKKHQVVFIDQRDVVSASEETIELSGTTDNMLVRTQ